MYERNKFAMQEEEYDQDKKIFAQEQRQAAVEKKLVCFFMLILACLWLFFAKRRIVEIGLSNWGWIKSPAGIIEEGRQDSEEL